MKALAQSIRLVAGALRAQHQRGPVIKPQAPDWIATEPDAQWPAACAMTARSAVG